jgi:hypothetical protein
VTEVDWNSCTDPQAMLTFLWDSDKLSQRKARLFACLCCRGVWNRLGLHYREAVDTAERLTEGLAVDEEAWKRFRDARGYPAPADRENAAARAAMAAYRSVANHPPHIIGYPPTVIVDVLHAAHESGRTSGTDKVQAMHCLHLRDLAGNPFHPLPTLAPSLLTWSDGLVRRLAEAAYEHRLLPAGQLDPERVAVLADALEEAGADAELVGHLRRPAAGHARGCWVLDLVLQNV